MFRFPTPPDVGAQQGELCPVLHLRPAIWRASTVSVELLSALLCHPCLRVAPQLLCDSASLPAVPQCRPPFCPSPTLILLTPAAQPCSATSTLGEMCRCSACQVCMFAQHPVGSMYPACQSAVQHVPLPSSADSTSVRALPLWAPTASASPRCWASSAGSCSPQRATCTATPR